MKGRVKFFNMTKGVGFIQAGGREYFVHFSDVESVGQPPLHVLLPGWEVGFEMTQAPRGYQAREVIPQRRSGLILNDALPPAPHLNEHRSINLQIDALGRIYAIAGRPVSPAIEAPGHFRAYYVGPTGPGKIIGFDLNLPASSKAEAYILLDPEKNPRRVKTDGIYSRVPTGSYFMKVERTGAVRVQNIGRRHDHRNCHNWLILEDRFKYQCNLSQASEESLLAQIATSGLARDNDGFVRGILRACEYMATSSHD